LLTLGAGTANGHGLRLAFMDVLETAPDHWHFAMKVPTFGERIWPMSLDFPERCAPTRPSSRRALESGDLEELHWMYCPRATSGEPVVVVVRGLEEGLVDLLVRVEWTDDATASSAPAGSIRLLTATASDLVLEPADASRSALSYRLRLGVEHILTGLDHLAFIAGIMLLMTTLPRVLVAVTAFTVAHSITLTLSTFDILRLPDAPVEAVIALSIVYLAVEVVRRIRDGGPLPSLRRAWSVAFVFGLLHGCGFAGALRATGLPESELPMTLALFNLGIELGQIVFAVGLAAVWFAFQRLARPAGALAAVRFQRRSELACAYLLGSLASFWTLERMAALVTA
jgi:hydrogenase/urease accessory protein HupE